VKKSQFALQKIGAEFGSVVGGDSLSDSGAKQDVFIRMLL
jgi:hypothetical protein